VIAGPQSLGWPAPVSTAINVHSNGHAMSRSNSNVPRLRAVVTALLPVVHPRVTFRDPMWGGP
jgi:hypothetical protein